MLSKCFKQIVEEPTPIKAAARLSIFFQIKQLKIIVQIMNELMRDRNSRSFRIDQLVISQNVTVFQNSLKGYCPFY